MVAAIFPGWLKGSAVSQRYKCSSKSFGSSNFSLRGVGGDSTNCRQRVIDPVLEFIEQ